MAEKSTEFRQSGAEIYRRTPEVITSG
jgi:hypothetical protein